LSGRTVAFAMLVLAVWIVCAFLLCRRRLLAGGRLVRSGYLIEAYEADLLFHLAFSTQLS